MEYLHELAASQSAFSACDNCKAENSSDKKFCPGCSFPVGGTEEEQRSFRLLVSSRKRMLSDANDKIKSAKYIIYFLAGIFFVFGLLAGFLNDDFPTLVINLFMCILYLIFAAWSTKNPFGAILTAFIVYITLQVVNAFVEPTSLASGIIIKIFVVAALVKGIRSARDAQEYLKELEKFKAAPVGNE